VDPHKWVCFFVGCCPYKKRIRQYATNQAFMCTIDLHLEVSFRRFVVVDQPDVLKLVLLQATGSGCGEEGLVATKKEGARYIA
jgi:hypothetical protein